MSYDSEVLADSPLVYLELNDTSGTTAADTSGNSRNGTYATTSGTGYQLNQTSIIPTRADGNVKFVSSAGSETTNPSTGYVTIPYGAWADLQDAFTVELWYQPPATRTSGVLAGHRSSVLQWGVIVYPSGEVSFHGWSSDTLLVNAFTTFSTGIDVFDGTPAPWHVVGVKDGTAMRLYINGALVDTAVAPANFRSNTTDAVGINSLGSAASQGVLGRIACFALYGSVLSAERISTHYLAGIGNEMVLAESFNAGDASSYGQTVVIADSMNVAAVGDPLAHFNLTLAASVAASAVQTLNQKLHVALLDSTAVTAAMVGSKFAQFLLAETVGLNAAAGVGSVSAMSLADMITAAVSLRAGDEEYVGWVINPNLAASTAAEGLNFLSMARHKAQYYGLKADGIYRLGGDTDAGANINAFVSLAQSDFGTPKQKRIPYAYIGAASDGRMLLRVLVNGQSYTYGTKNPSRDMAEQRVDIGKGLRGNYWQFELLNQNGEDFELDKVKFLPVVLERRI